MSEGIITVDGRGAAGVHLRRNEVVTIGGGRFRVSAVGTKFVQLEALSGGRVAEGSGDREQILIAALAQAMKHVPEHMRGAPLFALGTAAIGSILRERGLLKPEAV